MGTHPNVLLVLELTTDDLPMKTYRKILSYCGVNEDDDIDIEGKKYHHLVMQEDDYDDGWQIKSHPGRILFFDLVTYGYGDSIDWDVLESQKDELSLWSVTICDKFNCTSRIFVTANYW